MRYAHCEITFTQKFKSIGLDHLEPLSVFVLNPSMLACTWWVTHTTRERYNCHIWHWHTLWPRNLSWFRRFLEGTHQNCFCLLCGAMSASECPLVTFQICYPVADVVTHPVTTGLQQHNPGLHSVIPSVAAPVSHELGGTTRFLFIEVWPHHSAPAPTALAEHRRGSSSSCRAQVSA